MRSLLVVGLVVALVGTAGCCCSPATTGWSFQVGRPSVHTASTLLSPGMTSYGMAGVATSPVMGGVVATAPAHALALAAPMPTPLAAPRMGAAPDPCVGMTIEELCRRLLALEARVAGGAKKMEEEE